jgi:hypothetical protein
MSEKLSPWGTPSIVEKPAPVTSEVSPFHQETLAEVLTEQKRRGLGGRVLDMFKKKPESVVGDMSNSLHSTARLGNYRTEGLDNLTDGGLEKTGQYDISREEILGALQSEAQIEDSLRDNEKAQNQAEFFELDSQKPQLEAERAALDAKMVDAESITLSSAQFASLRQKSK